MSACAGELAFTAVASSPFNDPTGRCDLDIISLDIRDSNRMRSTICVSAFGCGGRGEGGSLKGLLLKPRM